MSDLIYNEIPDRPNWRDITIHDETRIHGFFGDFRFLSNFEPCILTSGYPSVENAYMAAKVKAEYRGSFKQMTPMEAKKQWKLFPLVDKNAAEWDARKFSVMFELLQEKFSQDINPDLFGKLRATRGKELIELNYWGDVVWGVDYRLGGQNMLGKMLMEIRDENT